MVINGDLFAVEIMEEMKVEAAGPVVEAAVLLVEAPQVEAPQGPPAEAETAVVQTEIAEVAAAPPEAENIAAPVEIEIPAETPVAVANAEAPEEVEIPQKRRASPKKAAAAKTGPSKRGRKSLKQVSAEADLIEIPNDEVLFGKQYYTMGEVSEMFRVNQSLLRFWETEFDLLQPRKNKKGDRYFRPVDIKNLHLIYHLLRQKKYTIEGAKDFLKKNKKAEERFEVIQRLQEIKTFLLEWKAQL